MNTYLDVDVPEELCRHLFLSFVRRPIPLPSSVSLQVQNTSSYTFPFIKPKSLSIAPGDHKLSLKDVNFFPSSSNNQRSAFEQKTFFNRFSTFFVKGRNLAKKNAKNRFIVRCWNRPQKYACRNSINWSTESTLLKDEWGWFCLLLSAVHSGKRRKQFYKLFTWFYPLVAEKSGLKMTLSGPIYRTSTVKPLDNLVHTTFTEHTILRFAWFFLLLTLKGGVNRFNQIIHCSDIWARINDKRVESSRDYSNGNF